jgi:hypothetical protein
VTDSSPATRPPAVMFGLLLRHSVVQIGNALLLYSFFISLHLHTRLFKSSYPAASLPSLRAVAHGLHRCHGTSRNQGTKCIHLQSKRLAPELLKNNRRGIKLTSLLAPIPTLQRLIALPLRLALRPQRIHHLLILRFGTLLRRRW